MDCLFCKIIAGEIPSKTVYEDAEILAFCDIQPQAPVHVLVIPKEHIPSVDGITAENSDVVAHIFQTIPKIAASLGLTGGYRVISNCGADAGIPGTGNISAYVQAGIMKGNDSGIG